MAAQQFWKDRSTAEEVSAALDDYADQLTARAASRREKAEIGRLRGYAGELRTAHGIADPGPQAPAKSTVAPLRAEGTG
jgi:hypothetical protein